MKFSFWECVWLFFATATVWTDVYGIDVGYDWLFLFGVLLIIKNQKDMQIGTIGNHYGHLEAKEEDGSYWWCIENWNGHYWEEIPKYLYDALIKFEKERTDESKP